jgi:acetyl esterase/lipase
VCICPATDLARTGESIQTNADRDAVLSPLFVQRMVEWYCPGKDPRDPTISPLYAELRGLPPLLIQAGEYEILRDDSTRFAQCAREVGVEVTLEIYP